MIHAFVLYCMVLNPTMCQRYEVVPWGYDPISSVIHCMMGGIIFAAEHHEIEMDGVKWTTDGKVRCEADPPRDDDVAKWVESEKGRLLRAEPQIK